MQEFNLFPESASTVAREIDALYLTWVGISLVSAVLIAIAVLYLFVKYRRTHDAQVGADDSHVNTLPIEIAWSVIPLIIVLAMFTWGVKIFFDVFRPPAGAVEYFVTGKQWMWKVQHPEGPREINTLHVPLGRKVKLIMTSEDVIHSFFIPAFRVKQDVLPGRYTTVWFEATKTGTFHLFCAEYCGAEHSLMGGKIVVQEPQEYEAWLATATGGTPMLASGQELFGRLSCDTCHRTTPDREPRAPALEGLFGGEVRLAGGGRLTADEQYIRESILEPQEKITQGWQPTMPTYRGQVSEEQINALVVYIRSLAGGAAPGATPAAATLTDVANAG